MAREVRRGGGYRRGQIAAQVQRVLAELICQEVKDPRLSCVTILDAEVERDGSCVAVFFSVSAGGDLASAQAGLEAASGFLRCRLAAASQLHFVPSLRFVHDPSTERGIRIGKLLDEALRSASPEGEESVPAR